jgi:hypothetical protein
VPKAALTTTKPPNRTQRPSRPSCAPAPGSAVDSLHWLVHVEVGTGEVTHRCWAWVPIDHPSQEPKFGWWALDATHLIDEAHLAQGGWAYAEPARPPGATSLRVVK